MKPVNVVRWAKENGVKVLEVWGFGDGVIGEKDNQNVILNGRYINDIPCVEQYNTNYAIVNDYETAEKIMDREPNKIHKITE